MKNHTILHTIFIVKPCFNDILKTLGLSPLCSCSSQEEWKPTKEQCLVYILIVPVSCPARAGCQPNNHLQGDNAEDLCLIVLEVIALRYRTFWWAPCKIKCMKFTSQACVVCSQARLLSRLTGSIAVAQARRNNLTCCGLGGEDDRDCQPKWTQCRNFAHVMRSQAS